MQRGRGQTKERTALIGCRDSCWPSLGACSRVCSFIATARISPMKPCFLSSVADGGAPCAATRSGARRWRSARSGAAAVARAACGAREIAVVGVSERELRRVNGHVYYSAHRACGAAPVPRVVGRSKRANEGKERPGQKHSRTLFSRPSPPSTPSPAAARAMRSGTRAPQKHNRPAS